MSASVKGILIVLVLLALVIGGNLFPADAPVTTLFKFNADLSDTGTHGSAYATDYATPLIQLVVPAEQLYIWSTFTCDLIVDTGDEPVAGIDAFVNFDPEYLSARQIIADTSVMQLQVRSRIDNKIGEIDYHALANLSEPFPEGRFRIASLQFTCLNKVATTSLSFNMEGLRTTVIAGSGDSILQSAVGCDIDIEYDVPLLLQPSDIEVQAGTPFTLDVLCNCASEQQVAAVDVFIDFDPEYLKALKIIPNEEFLPVTVRRSIDNDEGHLSYSAFNSMEEGYPSGCFPVATITFVARKACETTQVTVCRDGLRTSVIAMSGDTVQGVHGDTAVSVVQPENFRCRIQFPSGLRTRWQKNTLPLELRVYPENIILTSDSMLTYLPQYTFTTVDGSLIVMEYTPEDGVAIFEIELSPGIYTVAATSKGCLVNVKQNVEVSGSGTYLDMGTLTCGNVDDDLQISGKDFAMLLNDYLAGGGEENWNGGRCDFNGDGQVNCLDFSILISNYGKKSPMMIE